jgi:hypothetical protein
MPHLFLSTLLLGERSHCAWSGKNHFSPCIAVRSVEHTRRLLLRIHLSGSLLRVCTLKPRNCLHQRTWKLLGLLGCNLAISVSSQAGVRGHLRSLVDPVRLANSDHSTLPAVHQKPQDLRIQR